MIERTFHKLNRVMRWVGYAWILYTVVTVLALAYDVRSNPELWHLLPEGFDPAEQDEKLKTSFPEENWLEGLDFGFANTTGVDLSAFDGKRYVDWVYEVNNLRTYERMVKWAWPLLAWVLITFIVMRLNLELAEVRIKQLKQKNKKVRI